MSQLVTTDVSAITDGISDKVYFRPALFYQVIQPYHIVDSGLEFKMDFDTKVNKARFPNNVDFKNNPDRLALLKKQACKIVNESKKRDDWQNLLQRMKNAATWNDLETVKTLVQTCYVTPEIAIPTLLEAISNGHIDVVKFLIEVAGTPSNEFCSQSTIKNPLHVAAENGHENILQMLLSNLSTKEDCLVPTNDVTKQTIIDILKNNDMGMMAKRIINILQEKN
eukprot:g81.t1